MLGCTQVVLDVLVLRNEKHGYVVDLFPVNETGHAHRHVTVSNVLITRNVCAVLPVRITTRKGSGALKFPISGASAFR